HTVLHYETVHDTIQTRPHNWMSEVKLMPSLFDHASPVALEEGIFWQFTGDDAVNSNNFWFQPKARNHSSSFDLFQQSLKTIWETDFRRFPSSNRAPPASVIGVPSSVNTEVFCSVFD